MNYVSAWDINEQLLKCTRLCDLTNRIPGSIVRCDLLTDGILVQLPISIKGFGPHWEEAYISCVSLRENTALTQSALTCASHFAKMAVDEISEHRQLQVDDIKGCYCTYMYSLSPNVMLISHVWPETAQEAWDNAIACAQA